MSRTLLAALCLLGGLSTQQGALDLTKDQREIFALLDEFESLDTSKLPFVIVRAGNSIEQGFMEGTDGKQLHLRYVDLRRAVIDLTTATRIRAGVRFEPSDLRIGAARAISENKRRIEDTDTIEFLFELQDHNVQALYLARACARNALLAEVHALWGILPDNLQARETATARIGTALYERILLDFTDQRFSWTDLLARHDKWLAMFPTHADRERVSQSRDGIAKLLETMRQRKQPAGDAHASPADLVFALHDEFHLHTARSYLWSVAPSEPPRSPRTVDRLLALDAEAVPALIEALDDRSPTRCVVQLTRMESGFRVQSLGDLAELALVELTGFQSGDRDEALHAWRAWQERASKEGARKVMAEGVAALDRSAIERFLRRWPEDLETVLDAIRSHDGDRVGLLYLLMSLGNERTEPRVIKMGLEILHGSKEWQHRLDSASFLWYHGNDAGVAPVLAMWDRLIDGDTLDGKPTDPRSVLLAFLAITGNPAAWRSIARGCSSPATRKALAKHILSTSWPVIPKDAKASDRPEVEPLFRSSLALLLADDALVGEDVTFQSGARKVHLHEATCADAAACVLNAHWPQEYPFDPMRTATVRRRQIEALRGMPAPRTVAVLADESAASTRQRANVIERVSIDASATRLDAAAQARLRSMQGKSLSPDGIVKLLVVTAKAATPATVLFRFERTGEGEGTSLSVLFQPLDADRMARSSRSDGSGEAGDGWDAELRITMGGTPLRRESERVTSGRLDTPLNGAAWYQDALRKALRSDAGTGVEISFSLQVR